ncbi:hypothetical protein [Kitasatospora aureofaciens]|uniref:hypothetical protein n=1 Tax=Kitasatospora aureofaciens TaxID=1894 RepID=UPI000ADF0AF8|nr:hypothetical protein [Kitasatospora aureofaciens]
MPSPASERAGQQPDGDGPDQLRPRRHLHWRNPRPGPPVHHRHRLLGIYSQLTSVIPLTAKALTGSTAAISIVFTLNGALVLLCQYTLLRR